MGCCNSKKKIQAEEDRQKQREADAAAAKKQHAAEEEALKRDLHKADDIDMLAHEIAVDYVADHLGKNEISAEHAQDLVKEYKEEEAELKELAEREKEYFFVLNIFSFSFWKQTFLITKICDRCWIRRLRGAELNVDHKFSYSKFENRLEAEKAKLQNEEEVAEYAGVRLEEHEQKLKNVSDI